MRKYTAWCVCLLAWVIGWSTTALAESRYDALCADGAVNTANAAAWIEIPDADFCQPVMQHPSDDGFYAKHNAADEAAEYGTLYTQATYNAADFSDPVSVIYGSSQAEGAPLRDLQELYSGQFDECRTIRLHLPEETREYEVFAAVPYSSLHILHYYDFNVERRYEGFFKSVYSTRLLGMHLDKEKQPEFGDQVLILSTGLRGDKMQRYLVLAKRKAP